MYDNRDCTSDEDYTYFYENICDTAEFIFNQSPNANVYLLEMENASADISYSAGYDRFSEITDGGSKYEIHDLYIFKDNFDETTSKVDLTEEEIEASLKKQPDYGKMTEEEKENFRKTQRQLDMLSNNVVVSDAFDFVLNGKDSEKVVDTDIPTLCFSFFNDKNALYNENTGRDYLTKLKNNDNIFVNLIGSYDFSTYIGGYAYDLYQQTGGKRFNLKDDTLLSERLIKYIYELSESEELPEIENKYPMILSTGLEYVELDAPITIDYINAYRSITAANHNSSKFSGYADTDEDGLYDFEEINFGYDLIRRENGRVVLPTYGECIDKYSGLFYVEEGLDRYLNYAGYVELIDTKVLPIKSDPTSKDGDGDGYYDNDDVTPLKYENVPYLKELCDSAHIYANVYGLGIVEENALVLQFIRSRIYNDKLFTLTAGEVNESFNDYIYRNHYEVYEYFISGNDPDHHVYIIDPVTKNRIDFTHLAVTLNSYFYNDGFIKNAYTFVSDTDRVNDLAGWAGDLQSLVDEMILQVEGESAKLLSIQNVQDIISNSLGDENHSFGMEDFYSDIDAVNIYDVFCSRNKNVYQIIYQYYKNLTQKERMINFVNHYVDDKIFNENAYLNAYDEFSNYVHNNMSAYLSYSNVYNGQPIVIFGKRLFTSPFITNLTTSITHGASIAFVEKVFGYITE